VTGEPPPGTPNAGPGADLVRLTPDQFERFADYVYAKSGIRIPASKVTMLSNRIRRRLKARDFDDFDDYYRYLTGSASGRELEHFLDSITTNETSFFRTPHHFDWLKDEFLGEAVAQARRGARPRSLRFWSAGCASGAEPYTIAICLKENLYRLRDWELTVVGTDVSQEALREARAASFAPRALKSFDDPKELRRHFVKAEVEGRWQVRPDVRELVAFEYHNLMHPMAAPPFDCVFIRNVLIYFDRASKKTAIKHLIRALSPGGYLVVGPSEGIYDMLHPLERQHPFVYRKPVEDPS
jgi:chemotaxis protein methyltransferase CheR